MLLKYELQANCKWADGRQQNKVYKLPVLTLTLADFLSLSPQPPPPPPARSTWKPVRTLPIST